MNNSQNNGFTTTIADGIAELVIDKPGRSSGCAKRSSSFSRGWKRTEARKSMRSELWWVSCRRHHQCQRCFARCMT